MSEMDLDSQDFQNTSINNLHELESRLEQLKDNTHYFETIDKVFIDVGIRKDGKNVPLCIGNIMYGMGDIFTIYPDKKSLEMLKERGLDIDIDSVKNQITIQHQKEIEDKRKYYGSKFKIEKIHELRKQIIQFLDVGGKDLSDEQKLDLLKTIRSYMIDENLSDKMKKKMRFEEIIEKEKEIYERIKQFERD